MRSITFTLTFLALVSAGTVTLAQEVIPPAPYRASTQSTLTISENARNPFWPIGFTPRPKEEVGQEQLLKIPVEQFRVTSIILDNPSIALINGKDYTVGQFLTANTSVGQVKLLIRKIEDGAVIVQYKNIFGRIPISRR